MMQQGVWILMIILYTGRYEVELIPYAMFPNWQLCNAWKGRESQDLRLPMTCVLEGSA